MKHKYVQTIHSVSITPYHKKYIYIYIFFFLLPRHFPFHMYHIIKYVISKLPLTFPKYQCIEGQLYLNLTNDDY